MVKRKNTETLIKIMENDFNLKIDAKYNQFIQILSEKNINNFDPYVLNRFFGSNIKKHVFWKKIINVFEYFDITNNSFVTIK
jgi:hypothetical protein